MRTLFNNYVQNRFFNKLLLLYSAIIIMTIGILIYIVVTSITGLLREQAVTYNKQVLQLVSDHFHKQNKNLKKIMNDIYTANGFERANTVYEAFTDLEHSQSAIEADEAISTELRERAAFINRYMLDTALPSDPDILQLIMTNKAFSYEINNTRYTSSIQLGNYIDDMKRYIESRDKSNINSKRTYLLPALPVSNEDSSMTLYGIYDYIRPPDNPADYTGYTILTFNTQSFQRAYEQFEKYFIGTLLVLTPKGEVIYDSSGRYYAEPFPYWEQVQRSSKNTMIAGERSIVNVNKDEDYGFMTIGIIPLSELHMGINSINRKVLIAALICILITIALTVLSTTRFSRRLKDVLQMIRDIQKGNLSAKPLKEQHDEVGLIAHNLNLMSGKLDDYIKREFVLELRRKDSELKQKTAELYALQSQINPHFLYNTLEAIRMRALSFRDTETGRMIKILAKLFRSSIKDEMIITVQEEMNYCQSLLELYYIRFQGRLEVVFEVEEDILHYGVFRHMLQPIIENSIAHGIDLTRNDNIITVRGRQAGDYIIITVSDNGQGMERARLDEINEQLRQPRIYTTGSIGLLNVESRIKLIFGSSCGLSIMSTKGSGTEVIVTVLAKTKEALQSDVQSTDRR
ncbi:sensor histidine kinase [Paenibacillus sp. GCM10027626]|uniref:sensor histidine kinase n=1 Tax=Paenibacillus sp. GCM10027626 TaxID=3273411 RepID=UPI003634AC98